MDYGYNCTQQQDLSTIDTSKTVVNDKIAECEIDLIKDAHKNLAKILAPKPGSTSRFNEMKTLSRDGERQRNRTCPKEELDNKHNRQLNTGDYNRNAPCLLVASLQQEAVCNLNVVMKRSSYGNAFISARVEESVVEKALQQGAEKQQRSDFAIFEADSAHEYISEINTHRPIFPIALKDNMSSSRGQYWGTGRTIKIYQKRRAEEKERSSKKTTEFSASQKCNPEGNPDSETGDCFSVLDDETSMTIQTAFERLTVFVTPQMNAVKATVMGLSNYEMAKYRGVHTYFRELLSEKKKMKASKLGAQIA
ncbi:hypothetical protein DFQ28_008846 [Apophysomyces sp. BC1034]|nr:hypothetical protein DFQ29_005729 [Apophysomyces sp. BC1021]KAG0194588.1 hypothetical protein DFQ28_008846 [Apophysomyces sp. BC1034]